MIQYNWSFENLLINCSFIFLFIAMICYWIYLASFFKEIFLKLGKFSNIFANFSIFASLILRWINSGHFPLSNCATSKNKKFNNIQKIKKIVFFNFFQAI